MVLMTSGPDIPHPRRPCRLFLWDLEIGLPRTAAPPAPHRRRQFYSPTRRSPTSSYSAPPDPGGPLPPSTTSWTSSTPSPIVPSEERCLSVPRHPDPTICSSEPLCRSVGVMVRHPCPPVHKPLEGPDPQSVTGTRRLNPTDPPLVPQRTTVAGTSETPHLTDPRQPETRDSQLDPGWYGTASHERLRYLFLGRDV